MPLINAAEEDWPLLLSFFPPNWKQLATSTDALKGLRQDKSVEGCLRLLLMHLGCGLSMRETVARAQEAGLAVRTVGRCPPVWDRWKQPVVVAPSAALADRVLRIGGEPGGWRMSCD